MRHGYRVSKLLGVSEACRSSNNLFEFARLRVDLVKLFDRDPHQCGFGVTRGDVASVRGQLLLGRLPGEEGLPVGPDFDFKFFATEGIERLALGNGALQSNLVTLSVNHHEHVRDFR